ncbi:MAG: 16S rRNA (cytosine(967)-C(5))-methyltransferase RsmB, partial [Candidatus Competibacteraceae bacterium]|nr:16S rRNA (cytosine(967)-C(5))-methyltransferase RsmB [Candidatus Competibacteraceae bacterium]
AGGLVNAVLRQGQRRREALKEILLADPAHPPWLLKMLQRDWPEHWPAVVAANNAHPPLTLRVNLSRISREVISQRLAAAGLSAIPTGKAGLTLLQAVDVERLPGFAEGLLSVQDAAAQLAAPLLDPRPGQRLLDACAAPGGKTGHLLERCPKVELTALDLDPARLERVTDNLSRLGLEARVVTGNALEPAAWWDGRPFDAILLDAPCSGSGVIRRHPDIKLLRQPADIPLLARRQQDLLTALWPLLAPGGRLLYATCSVLRAENEAVIAAFLAQQPDARELPIEANWGEVAYHGRQILPGQEGMDGFFYACLGREPASQREPGL